MLNRNSNNINMENKYYTENITISIKLLTDANARNV